MKSIFSAVAILASLSIAAAQSATVTIKSIPSANASPANFDIPVGTLSSKLVNTTISLQVMSASGADANTISCQAFQDVKGTSKLGGTFNVQNAVSLSNSPIAVGAIKCDANAAVAASSSSSLGSPSSSGSRTSTGAATTTSASASTTSASAANSATGSTTMMTSATSTGSAAPAATTTGAAVAMDPRSSARFGLAVACAGLFLVA